MSGCSECGFMTRAYEARPSASRVPPEFSTLCVARIHVHGHTSPSAVVNSPITICALPGFLARLYPKAASSFCAPSSRRRSRHTRPPWEHHRAAVPSNDRAPPKVLLLRGQTIECVVEVIRQNASAPGSRRRRAERPSGPPRGVTSRRRAPH